MAQGDYSGADRLHSFHSEEEFRDYQRPSATSTRGPAASSPEPHAPLIKPDAAETIADLERWVNAFDVRKQTIEEVLAEATRVTAVVAALDARVATLTGPDHVLAHVEATIGHLERRAAEATADLEQRVTAFDAQRQTIQETLTEASRVTAIVAALDARVAALTGPDHVLEHVEATIGRLERRAAEATADLEQRVNAFDRQKQTIGEALADATGVTALVAALDARVNTLTRPNQALAHAEAAVGHLERRAAEATTRLQQTARAKDELELALANTQHHLQTLTESARRNAELLANASAGATSGRAGKTRHSLRRWAAGVAALAVLTLLAIIAMRSRDQPARLGNTSGGGQRESPLSPLPASASAPPDAQPTNDAVLPSAVGDPPARQPSPAPSTRKPRAAQPSRDSRSAADTVGEFVGVLGVQSVPPGAAVFIDQQRVGETPLRLTRLRAGSHAIRIEHESYQRWTTAVIVPANRETRVSATLQPMPDR